MIDKFVSIIIPVYNGSKTVGLCLESIFASKNKNFECIVVDDFSTDNTLDILKKFDIKTIELKKQKGAANARNIGVENSIGDILLFIDADVTIYPDCIDKVVQTFKNNPEISAIFGSYDESPDGTNICSQYKNLFHRYIHQTSNPDASTFWTACGAIYKETFQRIGGFDTNCRMMEDIDLGYRIKKFGCKILLNKDLHVKHLKRYNLLTLIKSDFFDRAIPWTILILKNKEYNADLNLKKSHKISALLIFAIIFSILLSIHWTELIYSIPLLFLAFLVFNINFYYYFYNIRGPKFVLKIIPLHMLYYFYSTIGYAIGVFQYHIQKSSPPLKY